jgi:hypothetical protein
MPAYKLGDETRLATEIFCINFFYQFKGMIRYKSLRLLLIILLSCYVSTVFSQDDSSLVKRFLLSNFSVFDNKKEIPLSFYKTFKKTTNARFLIANKDEMFNTTDVLVKGMPSRQLVFGGIDSTGKFGFIYYRTGGIVITSHVLFFDTDLKKEAKFFSLVFSDQPDDQEELKKSVMMNFRQ